MDTKGHCFPKSIIIQAVYFKLRFSLSYRDIEEIMRIRGVEVDHATIQRWVYKFMPEIEIQMRQNPFFFTTYLIKMKLAKINSGRSTINENPYIYLKK